MSKETLDDLTEQKYGVTIPLAITANDKAPELRKFFKAVGEKIATSIIQTWLMDSGAYEIDITITMRKVDS
jgi:hypothetical protein